MVGGGTHSFQRNFAGVAPPKVLTRRVWHLPAGGKGPGGGGGGGGHDTLSGNKTPKSFWGRSFGGGLRLCAGMNERIDGIWGDLG